MLGLRQSCGAAAFPRREMTEAASLSDPAVPERRRWNEDGEREEERDNRRPSGRKGGRFGSARTKIAAMALLGRRASSRRWAMSPRAALPNSVSPSLLHRNHAEHHVLHQTPDPKSSNLQLLPFARHAVRLNIPLPRSLHLSLPLFASDTRLLPFGVLSFG